MVKSIIKRLKYISKIQISEYDKDNIEPICFLNIFTDGHINYGWKEYDYRINKPLKSDNWKIGCYYFMKFIPKEEEKHSNQNTTIIQRLKETDVRN